MPWERLQEGPDESFTDDLDADVLLSEGRTGRPTSFMSFCPTQLLHNFATSRHKYWILFFLTTLLIVSLLPIILVVRNQRTGTLDMGKPQQHPIRIPGVTTPPPFMDPLVFDTNATETSIRSFSPPEFSPILDFIYDYFSLVQSTDTVTNVTMTKNTTLEVTVYYESLSIPSRLFLGHLFFPTYFKMGREWSAKLIPFGHAQFVQGQVNGTEKLKCENNQDECEGNLVQACAIRHTRWNDTTSVDRLMRFIKCHMADTGKGGDILDTAQDSTGINCARMVGVDWDPIYNCSKSSEGLVILHKFKERTDTVLKSGNDKGVQYPLPVVEVKGYGVLSEEDKKQFPRFIQTRLDMSKQDKTGA